jgi:hypothetical protein
MRLGSSFIHPDATTNLLASKLHQNGYRLYIVVVYHSPCCTNSLLGPGPSTVRGGGAIWPFAEMEMAVLRVPPSAALDPSSRLG